MARNPFRVRASSRGVNDEQFVKMFAASAIEIMKEPKNPWQGLVYVRSAPGGGKTSILRMLTPGPLRRAIALGDDQRYRAIREALQDASVLDGNTPMVWGVLLSFSIEYRTLDDLGPKALPVFRALISARIVLAALKALLSLREMVYPDDLARVSAAWTPIDGAQMAAKANGVELDEWASKIEDSVFEIMDELGGDGSTAARGLLDLDGLYWLAGASFAIDDQPVVAKPVLLLDDLQYLSDDMCGAAVRVLPVPLFLTADTSLLDGFRALVCFLPWFAPRPAAATPRSFSACRRKASASAATLPATPHLPHTHLV